MKRENKRLYKIKIRMISAEEHIDIVDREGLKLIIKSIQFKDDIWAGLWINNAYIIKQHIVALEYEVM